VAVGADAQITDLTADDHACLTFGEPEELFDLTAAFVRDGLACGLSAVPVRPGGIRSGDAGVVLLGADDMTGVSLVSGHDR